MTQSQNSKNISPHSFSAISSNEIPGKDFSKKVSSISILFNVHILLNFSSNSDLNSMLSKGALVNFSL